MLGEVVAGLRLVSAHAETRVGELFIGECEDGRCAVKLLRPALCVDRARVDRAFAAARTAGALDHRGIEFVIEAGWDGDRAYVLGDIIPGTPLAKLVAHHRLDADAAIALLRLAADALAAAHAAGIHHGALEPIELLVGFAADRVVVRDFGLAELLAADATATGAPADVHALGRIAAELLPSRSDRIDDLIRRMLATDPAARPTMADARDELAGSPPRPPRTVAAAPPDVAAIMAAAAAEATDEPTPPPGPPPEPPD